MSCMAKRKWAPGNQLQNFCLLFSSSNLVSHLGRIIMFLDTVLIYITSTISVTVSQLYSMEYGQLNNFLWRYRNCRDIPEKNWSDFPDLVCEEEDSALSSNLSCTAWCRPPGWICAGITLLLTLITDSDGVTGASWANSVTQPLATWDFSF